MPAWFDADIFPNRDTIRTSGLGMWIATLIIPWVIIWAIGNAIWSWGATGWWFGFVAICCLDLGAVITRWELRRR